MLRMSKHEAEICQLAAKLILEGGLELGAARQQAIKNLKLTKDVGAVDTAALLAEAQLQLRLYYPQHAPHLASLRQLALRWMDQLADFSPLLRGNVWLGLAMRHSPIYLDLYAQSPKDLEVWLINQQIDYSVADDGGDSERSPHLICSDLAPNLHYVVEIHLQVHDADQIRGALKARLAPGADTRLRASRADLAAIMQP